jgi:NAD(P)-dependent dehydrogenase (short-subunit alcohol dehydrogenase family)
MADKIDLKGRVAIVTGGSQGLGFEMALGLVQAGARVTIASIDADKLETARSAIGPDCCHTVVADISKPDDCQRIFQQTLDRFGGLAVLVNNARAYGDTPHKPLWETDPE